MSSPGAKERKKTHKIKLVPPQITLGIAENGIIVDVGQGCLSLRRRRRTIYQPPAGTSHAPDFTYKYLLRITNSFYVSSRQLMAKSCLQDCLRNHDQYGIEGKETRAMINYNVNNIYKVQLRC